MSQIIQDLLDAGDPVTLYAMEVGAGRIVAGPLVRLACKRHLSDLEEGGKRGLTWDLKAAMHTINFFPTVLRLADGVFAEKPFHLELWQKFIVGCLFGWKGSDGFRRFRTAYVEIGKGNGKSPLAAGIGLYGLIADGEAGAEIYGAATKLEQAKILFRDATRMVESSPALSKRITKHQNNLAYLKNGSFFRPVSSEKRGLDGPRPHMGLIDELHEHPDAIVVDKIRAGTKGRRQAMIFEITNSGFDKTTVCWNHHEYSERILRRFASDNEGFEDNDTWFAYICGLDEHDDWMKDPTCWVKANPNLGISITEKYLQEQVNEARGMPSKQSIVARLNFCQWVGAENPWISREMWESCVVKHQHVMPVDWYRGKCYGGLDLSARKDLTALGLVWKLDEAVRKKRPDGVEVLVKYRARVLFWTPKDTMHERAKEDKVPYAVWEEQNYIHTTPGNIVDYSFVAHKVGELDVVHDLECIAFDPWRIDLFQMELDDQGIDIDLRPHSQAYTKPQKRENGLEGIWMPKSIEELESAILKGEIEIEDNPVLHWCSASAVLIADPAGNRKFDKRKATGRIDGLVALAMAMGAATSETDTGWSSYQYHDFVEIGG